jgi:hypothetical protein
MLPEVIKMKKQYYRSNLPSCLLQLIGQFAGTEDCYLVFTITPKRLFLGEIFLECPHRLYENQIWRRKFKKKMWRPTSFVPPALRDLIMNKIIRSMYWDIHDNGKLFCEFLSKLEHLFNEINNYALIFPREI